MGKDTRTYRYIELGLKRDSELLARLLKDAETCHMKEHLPLFIATRLVDYYRMIDHPVQAVTTTTIVDVERKSTVLPPLAEKASVQMEEEASEEEQMANADGAADFFGVL